TFLRYGTCGRELKIRSGGNIEFRPIRKIPAVGVTVLRKISPVLLHHLRNRSIHLRGSNWRTRSPNTFRVCSEYISDVGGMGRPQSFPPDRGVRKLIIECDVSRSRMP